MRAVEIRKIRAGNAGCWNDVVIESLGQGLNVIHLDDGGRAVDFSRFLHGVLFGFGDVGKQTLAGSVVVCGERDDEWVLERDHPIDSNPTLQIRHRDVSVSDTNSALRRLQGSIDGRVAEYLFVPKHASPAKEGWAWLKKNAAVAGELIAQPQQRPGVSDGRQVVDKLSINPSANERAVENLAQERERCLSEVTTLRQRLRDVESTKPQRKSTPALIAELTDELRSLEMRSRVLAAAEKLADRWTELQELRADPSEPISEDVDGLLNEYRLLQQEKRGYQQLSSVPAKKKPSTKPRRAEIREIERLLNQREWVESATAPTPETPEVRYDELHHAGYLFDVALREVQLAQDRMTRFSKQTDFDWSDLLTVEQPTSPAEFAEDSPFAHEAPERQLSELKRRRLWLREEHRCLLDQVETTPLLMMWIAILFTLSVAALFGTLLVASTTAQWPLVAFGLCGLVSSGALKLSIDLRTARMLNRAKDRLHRIDCEILTLTQTVLEQQHGKEAARRRAEHKLYAIQLQQDVSDVNRRLDSAESSFRELLALHDLPLHLSPTEASRKLRHRKVRTRSSDGSDDHKLRRWIQRARDVIRQCEGVRPGKDPLELISRLELARDQLRNTRERSNAIDSSDYLEEERKEARRQLRRLKKRQSTILERAGVEDVYGLEAAVAKARSWAKKQRRIDSIERELTIAIESDEDPDELRELLEMLDSDDIRLRLSEVQNQLRDTEQELARQQNVAHTDAGEDIRDDQVRLDQALLQLGLIDTKIRNTVRDAQTSAAFEHVAKAVRNRTNFFNTTVPYLAELTNNRWETIRLTASGFELQDSQGNHVSAELGEWSEVAWLAIQLQAAAKVGLTDHAVPLVLLVDSLLASSRAAETFDALRRVCEHERWQMFLLVGNRQLANQLAEAGAPVVRLALREQKTHEAHLLQAEA